MWKSGSKRASRSRDARTQATARRRPGRHDQLTSGRVRRRLLGFAAAPLDLTLSSEPIPDVFVVPGKPRDYTAHPTTALLIVEVSDSTLSHDRNRKGSLYAAALIQDYWIVNLVDRQLEVYRVPVPDAAGVFGFTCSQRTILAPGATVSPLALPQAQIAVTDLLP